MPVGHHDRRRELLRHGRGEWHTEPPVSSHARSRGAPFWPPVPQASSAGGAAHRGRLMISTSGSRAPLHVASSACERHRGSRTSPRAPHRRRSRAPHPNRHIQPSSPRWSAPTTLPPLMHHELPRERKRDTR
jgi:hypothetical protein